MIASVECSYIWQASFPKRKTLAFTILFKSWWETLRYLLLISNCDLACLIAHWSCEIYFHHTLILLYICTVNSVNIFLPAFSKCFSLFVVNCVFSPYRQVFIKELQWTSQLFGTEVLYKKPHCAWVLWDFFYDAITQIYS